MAELNKETVKIKERSKRIIKPKSGGPFGDRIQDITQLIFEKTDKKDIKKVYLFGSYAYGKPGKDSDLDIFVIVDNNCNDWDVYMNIKLNLKHNKIVPCDLIVEKETEFKEKMKLNKNNIQNTILKKGILLYG
jgi:predicted nucleotidyltransferase